MTTPEHTIAALCKRSRDISLEKGWLNPDGTDPRPFYTVIGLFHTELSEAFEDARNNKSPNELYYEAKFKESDGTVSHETIPASRIAEARNVEGKFGRGRDFIDAKPCGIPVELADFVIRVCQYIGSAGPAATAKFSRYFNDADLDFEDADNLEKFITNTHRDVSNAYERSDLPGDGVYVRLSDAVARVFNYCEKNNIDLWAAVDEKEAYNRTRSTRHGGKKH